MRVLRSLVPLLALGALVSGCSMFETSTPTGKTPIIPKPTSEQQLAFPLDRTLVAVSYKDQQFKDDRPTLLVSASNRGTGFSACNNWSATITPRSDGRIGIGPVAISKRVCDERLMHNEKVFLFVLGTAQKWSYDGKTFKLEGPFGVMAFESAV